MESADVPAAMLLSGDAMASQKREGKDSTRVEKDTAKSEF